MQIADLSRSIIQGIYALSPYAWVDRYLEGREQRHLAGSDEQRRLRARRLALSERYIGYWFFGAIGLWMMSPYMPAWVGIPLMLRVIGILNKELGVVLFGVCKITEGTAVSATGRVIVLALTNYLTALFLMAAVYSLAADFVDLPLYVAANDPLVGLVHAAQVHFSLASSFTAANMETAALTLFHSAYCFLFGALVISLFVSLLSVKPLDP